MERGRMKVRFGHYWGLITQLDTEEVWIRVCPAGTPTLTVTNYYKLASWYALAKIGFKLGLIACLGDLDGDGQPIIFKEGHDGKDRLEIQDVIITDRRRAHEV